MGHSAGPGGESTGLCLTKWCPLFAETLARDASFLQLGEQDAFLHGPWREGDVSDAEAPHGGVRDDRTGQALACACGGDTWQIGPCGRGQFGQAPQAGLEIVAVQLTWDEDPLPAGAAPQSLPSWWKVREVAAAVRGPSHCIRTVTSRSSWRTRRRTLRSCSGVEVAS